MTQHLNRRLRRATGLGAVAMLARAPRRTGRRLPRAAVRELQQRPRWQPARPSRCVPSSTTAAAARRSATGIAALQRRHASPRRRRPGRPCSPPTPGTQLGTFTSELSGTSSAPRALARQGHGRLATSAPASTCPAAPPSIIGDDNLVVVVRRTPSGRAPDVRARRAHRRRQARRAGRQLDAAGRDARPAQLDRLRRQEPRHHAQPGQPDRA